MAGPMAQFIGLMRNLPVDIVVVVSKSKITALQHSANQVVKSFAKRALRVASSLRCTAVQVEIQNRLLLTSWRHSVVNNSPLVQQQRMQSCIHVRKPMRVSPTASRRRIVHPRSTIHMTPHYS
jgi:hypothetical protein